MLKRRAQKFDALLPVFPLLSPDEATALMLFKTAAAIQARHCSGLSMFTAPTSMLSSSFEVTKGSSKHVQMLVVAATM